MNPTHAASPWRRMAIGSFVALVSVALAWNGAAFAIDSSGLDRGDSWPMIFGSVFGTLLFGSAPILISLVAAVAAGLGTPGMARPSAWCGAGVAAVCAAGLLLAAGSLVRGSPAEVAFGVVSALSAVALLAPLALCIRQEKKLRSRTS